MMIFRSLLSRIHNRNHSPSDGDIRRLPSMLDGHEWWLGKSLAKEAKSLYRHLLNRGYDYIGLKVVHLEADIPEIMFHHREFQILLSPRGRIGLRRPDLGPQPAWMWYESVRSLVESMDKQYRPFR